jgi:hypothetical protein
MCLDIVFALVFSRTKKGVQHKQRIHQIHNSILQAQQTFIHSFEPHSSITSVIVKFSIPVPHLPPFQPHYQDAGTCTHRSAPHGR